MEENQQPQPSQQTIKPESKKVTLELSKLTLWKVISGVLLVGLIISIFTSGFGFGNGGGSTAGTTIRNTGSDGFPTGAAVVDAKQLEDDDPFLGDEDAPLTMVEFSDFQCPFCKRYRDQTFDLVKSEYIDTGKVKFVYRDFPLTSIHPLAQKSAEAAECADDQGKFWEYHDLLFERQDEWVSIGGSKFKDYAQDLNLDTNEFNDCLDSGKYTREVNNDLQDATSAGGRGTPFFVIGTTPVSGAQPFPVFQAAIEAELSS